MTKLGRPPHFDNPDEMWNKFLEYAQKCTNPDWLIPKEGEKPIQLEKRPLTVSGFCNYIESYKDLLNEYSKREAFSGTIKKIYSMIENNIEEGLLQNKYNSAGAIFNLKNNFGWKDKVDHELTGKDGQPLKIILDKDQSDV
jgi:hypothetical protein